MLVLRPGDAAETSVCWKMAMENDKTPTALILSRQDIGHTAVKECACEVAVGERSRILKECVGLVGVGEVSRCYDHVAYLLGQFGEYVGRSLTGSA